MKTKEGEKVHIKENFKEYLSYLKKHKLLLFFTFLTVFLVEAKSLSDRYLFKIVVDKGTEFSAGNLLSADFLKILLIIAGVYIALSIFSSIMNWMRFYLSNKLDSKIIYELKQKYFRHLIHLDHNFYSTHKIGSLISKLGRGASAIERTTDTLVFEFGPLVLQLIISTSVLIYLDKLSALIIFITILLLIGYSYFMQRRAEPASISLNKTDDLEKGHTADFFTNIDSIRHYGKENYILSKYKSLISNTQTAQLKRWGYWRWVVAGQGLILATGTFFLIFFSVSNLLDGKTTIGTLTFIYTAYLGLMGPLFSFVSGMRNFSHSMADFQELFEYGKFENEIKESPQAEKLKIGKGEIEFKNVCFNYGKRKIFDKFNLKINPNEKVALVGHSGSGKTTLVKLLYRLYEINSGEILIDKRNIKDFKQTSLRAELSNVPQECILFDDTIFNNIKFSKPEATKDEVMRAIKFAQLDKVIANFPLKENTVVGERGVKLSGGEKQRVSIARAILADKKILVLDEATSSLDSETEHEIQKDLAKLLEGRTSIIIAHRLSTIMNADKIVVLKNGKIIQIGNHKELISKEGEYKKLWNLQKGGYIK